MTTNSPLRSPRTSRLRSFIVQWDERMLRYVARQYRLPVPAAWRYGLALVFLAVAVAARLAMTPRVVFSIPCAIGLPIIGLTTALLGLGPGLLVALAYPAAIEVLVLRLFPGVLHDPMTTRIGLGLGSGIFLVLVLQAMRTVIAGFRVNNDRYRLLFEANPNPMWVFAEDTLRFMAVNEAAIARYGYSRGEFLALTVLDVRTPEERATMREVIEGQRGLNNATVGVFQHRAKNGTPMDMEVTISSITFMGQPARLCMMNDVTSRVKVNTALAQSEERFRLLVDQTVDGIFVSDANGHYTDVNNAGCQMLGYSRQEILGLTIAQVVAREEVKRIGPEVARFADGKVVRSEWRFRRKDGSFFVGEVVGRQLPDGRLQAILRDITERRQDEDDQRLTTDILRLLNQSGDDLHTLIGQVLHLLKESAGFDAVALRLREGEDCPYHAQVGFTENFVRQENFLCAKAQDGSIIRDAANQPVLECTCGLVLSGRTDPKIPCFTEGGSFWTNNSWQLVESLTPQTDARRNPRNRCIDTGYLSFALLPVHADGQIIGLLQLNALAPNRFRPERIRLFESMAGNLGMAVQRYRAEKALRDAKITAETATKAKDQFIAVLSHELRTPLTPAVAAMSLLRKDARLPDDVREDLEMVSRNLDLEVRLIADLLDVSRITSGKLHMEKRPVDLSSTIREAAAIVAGDLDAKNQTLAIDTPGAPYMALADAARLQQVFWNLLRNSIKFSPHGSHIAIRARMEHLQRCPLAAQPCPVSMGDCPLPQGDQHQSRGQNLIVEVIDHGSGIAPEMLPRIFDAFHQEQKARTFGGLGLGLSICKSVLEMHGGSISATSPGIDRGTVFTIRLPVAQCALPTRSNSQPPCQVQARSNAAATAADSHLRILLVEDHADTAKLMSRLLMMQGYEVAIASSVAGALSAIQQQVPNIIISDLGLPDGSGLDLMRQLRAQGHTMPAISLSGYGAAGDIEQSKAAGFAEHFVKPLTGLDGLTAALARLGS